jgi:hypothetical protein
MIGNWADFESLFTIELSSSQLTDTDLRLFFGSIKVLFEF